MVDVAVPDGASPQAVERIPPVALVLTGIVSVQFGAAIATTLFDEVGAAGASLLRVVFGAAIMALVFRVRVRGYSAADMRLVVCFGLALGAMNLAFYEALDRIPLGVAVTVEFVGPLSVAVLGSRRALDLLWVVLAAAGIVLLANPLGASGIDALGLVFALVAGLCWALYIVLAARAGPRFRGADGVTIALVVATVVPLGSGIAEGGADLLRPELLALGAAVGLLSSAIPYTLEMEALRRMPRRVFSVLMSVEPAVAALAGLIVLGQGLAAHEVVAIALVVAASAGATRNAMAPVDA